jgi:DNA-directed RNA polymerase specialized sigma24 family protein
MNTEIERHFKELQNYAYLICGQRNLMYLADELLQESILIALSLPPEDQKIIREPIAFIKALMRRSITLPNTKFYRQYISCRKTIPLNDNSAIIDEEQESAIYDTACQWLECCFTWNDRQLFYLHLKRGWSAVEIHEYTGISYRDVRERLNAIKDKLRLLMEHNYEN